MRSTDYKKELEKDYNRWNDVYMNGCNDPSWADGVNLNLIRNHIIIDKRNLKESLSESELPDLYFLELPPEVDNNYMAKTDEIMEVAKHYYDSCTSLEEWNKLLDAFDFLESKDSKQESMRFFIQRIKGLKAAIDLKDYVYMRRFKDPIESIQLIKEYAEQLDDMELTHLQQITLF
ncbi:hypothetical protein MKD14_15550 [[Clostridium] innocuum]|nr:hypothetical protein [[Clostridium] innocuum]